MKPDTSRRFQTFLCIFLRLRSGNPSQPPEHSGTMVVRRPVSPSPRGRPVSLSPSGRPVSLSPRGRPVSLSPSHPDGDLSLCLPAGDLSLCLPVTQRETCLSVSQSPRGRPVSPSPRCRSQCTSGVGSVLSLCCRPCLFSRRRSRLVFVTSRGSARSSGFLRSACSVDLFQFYFLYRLLLGKDPNPSA